jgi:cation diffusion facilitator family transporter
MVAQHSSCGFRRRRCSWIALNSTASLHSGMATLLGRVERESAVRRGQWLSWLTLGYNSLEGVIAITAGVIAGSIALVGFGFDSLIEVTASVAALWRLSADVNPDERERVERATLRIVGALFIALAIYVTWDAAKALLNREGPEESRIGIALAAVSLVVMPILARAKRKVAIRLGSRALRSEAQQTQLCTYLSAILLGGLALNAVFGWWWADPVAALIMVPIIGREGVEALRGHDSCNDTCG